LTNYGEYDTKNTGDFSLKNYLELEMNFDLMIERLVRFRNRLERFGIWAAFVSFLVFSAVFMLSVTITHRPLPPFSEILGFSAANWVWDITAYCLLLAMTLPEYADFFTGKYTWASFGKKLLKLLHWVLQWALWAIVFYLCVLTSVAILVWLISVL
jgi:hypothetical protein